MFGSTKYMGKKTIAYTQLNKAFWKLPYNFSGGMSKWSWQAWENVNAKILNNPLAKFDPNTKSYINALSSKDIT